MNDEQKTIDQAHALTGIPKEEIVYIIQQMQHAYHDEQERQYREMKQEIGYRCTYSASHSRATDAHSWQELPTFNLRLLTSCVPGTPGA